MVINAFMKYGLFYGFQLFLTSKDIKKIIINTLVHDKKLNFLSKILIYT